MDFDFKSLITVIISLFSLILSMVNWRTNIKIKNQTLSIKFLESDILTLIKIKTNITDGFVKLITIKRGIYPLNNTNIVNIIFDGLKEVESNEVILKEWGIYEDIEKHLKPINSMSDIQTSELDILINIFKSISIIIDNEIIKKRKELQNYFM